MTSDPAPLVLAAPTDLPAVLDHQAVPDLGSLPTEPSDPLQEADLPEVNAPRTPAVLTRLQVRLVAFHPNLTTILVMKVYQTLSSFPGRLLCC